MEVILIFLYIACVVAAIILMTKIARLGFKANIIPIGVVIIVITLIGSWNVYWIENFPVKVVRIPIQTLYNADSSITIQAYVHPTYGVKFLTNGEVGVSNYPSSPFIYTPNNFEIECSTPRKFSIRSDYCKLVTKQ